MTVRPLVRPLFNKNANSVMAGLVPAIHVLRGLPAGKTWMPATSVGMTASERLRLELIG